MQDYVKDTLVKMRITKSDKEVLERIAASQNLSLSAYMRAKLMKNKSTAIKSDIPYLFETYRVLNELCREIDKSGDEHLMASKQHLLKTLANHKEN